MNENNTNLIYEKLRTEIICMELEPGKSISEIETAKRFNVSRTPIRDVFKRLENEGLLVIKPHIGTFVSLIDLDYITDILYMREKIEFAVIQDLTKSITKSQIVKLKITLEKQENLFNKNYSIKKLTQAFILSDNEFHKTLFSISGRANIWNYLSSLGYHYERFRMFVNMKEENIIYELLEEHKKMLEFISKKDLQNLEILFTNHLYTGVDRCTFKIYENPEYFKEV